MLSSQHGPRLGVCSDKCSEMSDWLLPPLLSFRSIRSLFILYSFIYLLCILSTQEEIDQSYLRWLACREWMTDTSAVQCMRLSISFRCLPSRSEPYWLLLSFPGLYMRRCGRRMKSRPWSCCWTAGTTPMKSMGSGGALHLEHRTGTTLRLS